MSTKSQSPLNSLFGRLSGIAAAQATFGGGGGKGKIKKRVSKLENQVRSLDQKMYSNGQEDEGPAFQTGAQGDFASNVISTPGGSGGGEQLSNPTFTPGAQQAGEEMFGSKMPGSFDRSMDQEEIY